MSEVDPFSHVYEANKSSWKGYDSYKGVLISLGCSHTAGSETLGVGDSDEQRQLSYGAKIAEKWNYQHLNYAQCGGSNHRIFDQFCTIMNDVESGYGYYAPIREDYNYFFLIGWTSLNRLDMRYKQEDQNEWKQAGDYGLRADNKYIPATVGTNPLMLKDKEIRKAFDMAYVWADDVIAANRLASYIYAIQSMMTVSPYKYYMFNAIENFYYTHTSNPPKPHQDITFPPFVGNQKIYTTIDEKYYYKPMDKHFNYYRWCTEVKGHAPKSQTYWHLGEQAHIDWAEHIYPEIMNAYPDLA